MRSSLDCVLGIKELIADLDTCMLQVSLKKRSHSQAVSLMHDTLLKFPKFINQLEKETRCKERFS